MSRRNLLRGAGLFVIGMVLFAWPEPVHVSQSADFTRLFADYRGTNADRAVREFALWSDERVQRDAVLPPDQSDPWSVAALALFHLEASFAARSGRDPASTEPWSGGSHMIDTNRFLNSAITDAERLKDPELLQFYRNWLLARGTTIRDGLWIGYALDPISLRLNDDAQVQLSIGASAASRMGPRLPGLESVIGQSFGVSHGPMSEKEAERLITARGEDYQEFAVRQAEVAFRKALELDPSLTEARVRLGRVLDRTNRSKDGIAELERASAEALQSADRWHGYLSNLFLGQACEDTGERLAAAHAYEEAVARYPTSPAARLALGQFLIRAGHASEGHAMSRSVFSAEARPTMRDPWTFYDAPGYWQGSARLAAMRARVSKTPFSGVVTIQPDLAIHRLAGVAPAIDPAPAVLEPRSVSSDRIRLDVLVTDGGRPVPNLTAADFRVVDNSAAQRIETVRRAEFLSAAFVLDTSPSMGSTASWKTLQESVERLRQALRPGDVISVVTAADRITLRADQLKNPDALPALVAGLRAEPQGLSSIWDSVIAATGLVAEGPGRPIVVVVSDGYDNSSWFRRRLAIARLPSLGVIVDGISVPFETQPDWRDMAFGDINLRDPAQASGGVAFVATDSALQKKLIDRFATLRQSYVLTYTPENTINKSDGWHNIKVTLNGIQGKVQVQPGYWAGVGR